VTILDALGDLVVWFVTLIQRVVIGVGLGVLLVCALIGVALWTRVTGTRP
jgi:hypothetical protein